MRRWTALWLAGLLLGLWDTRSGLGLDTNEREVEEDNGLASQLVTPHKPWGRGYVGGPVRALFIVSSGPYAADWSSIDTRMREVVELNQRFDLQSEAILIGQPGKGAEFHGGSLGERRAERLLAQPYDVYVFANFPIDKLPPRYQYLVMEQVAKGAGLVCCGPGAPEFMTAARQTSPLPAMLTEGLPLLDGKTPDQVLGAYRLGQGRGAWLKYPAWALTPSQKFSWAALAEYDYRLLWVGRAVLWAAGRDSQLTLSYAGAGTIDQARLGQPDSARDLSFSLAGAASRADRVKVALEVRRASDGWQADLGTVAAKIAGGEAVPVPVPLPVLRTGRYFVDAVVTGAKGVEAFGAAAFEVTGDTGIERVELDRAFAESGEKVQGAAALRGTPPAASVLQLRFRDSYDRVLDQRDLAVVAGQVEYPFEYVTTPFCTILMRVEAALVVNGQELEMRDTSFTVPKRRRQQFNFLQWDTPQDVLSYYTWQQLRRAGMSLCLLGSFGPSQPVPALLANGISVVPYSTRILDPKDENGVMKPYCWNDEPNITKYVQGIVDNQTKHREHGVFVYSLGDEGVTLGCCVHPACIAAYRRYLAAQYGTIEALNRSWGTSCKAFEEVDLLDHKDNMENAALGQGLYARWYDRQAFARYNLMQFSGRFVKAYRELDPQAVTGFEGTGGFGDDYDTILGINTFYSPYPSLGDDIIRSAAPRELIRANWMGYSKTIDPLADAAWRMVIKGMDSIWFWMWTGIGNWRGYVSPTLDYWPATAELAEEMRPVRNGLGDLLLQSRMTHSGIGILYSLPSALSHNIENSKAFTTPEAAHQTWVRLTYELGLDLRYLTCDMLKRGALDVKEFRVLLLPMTQALAPTEAAAIAAFVQAGGQVVADVRPGVFDEHCKPVTPGPLDELFGLRRSNRDKAVQKPVTVSGSLAGQPLDLQLVQSRIDPGVEATTAQALGRVDSSPLFLVNQLPSGGRAILLNFQLLSDKEDEAQVAAARRFVKAIYDAAGVKPRIAFSAPDGEALALTETRVWENGEAEVFGLWRQMQCAWFSPKSGTAAGPPVPARITLPAARHVYDLRAGKYLGEVREVSTQLRWGRANFFLALPYRIGSLGVDLSSDGPARGQPVTVGIRVKQPAEAVAKLAVLVEVSDPEQTAADWARQVLLLERGRGTVHIPVAFNDRPGKWRLRATELFSGQSDTATWRVR